MNFQKNTLRTQSPLIQKENLFNIILKKAANPGKSLNLIRLTAINQFRIAAFVASQIGSKDE
jgi:hypothetical protein